MTPLSWVFVIGRPQTRYGAQQSLLTLLTHLDPKRVQPIVLTAGEGPVVEALRVLGFDPVIIPTAGREAGCWARLVSLLQGLGWVYRWLGANPAAGLYVDTWWALLVAGVPAYLRRWPVLWYVRGEKRNVHLNTLGLALATRVITIAEAVGQRAFYPWQRWLWGPKLITLYTGFALPPRPAESQSDLRAQWGLPLDAMTIGLVGALSQRKGHDLLLAALPTILAAHPQAMLVFAGDSPPSEMAYRATLQSQIDRLGLGSRIVWTGFVQDMACLYPALDLVVLPSRSEGLPRVVLEALAAGRPVVATDVGGVREILRQPGLGWMVPKDQVDALAAAVTEALGTPDTPARQDARRHFVATHFSIPAFVEGFTQILHQMPRRPCPVTAPSHAQG